MYELFSGDQHVALNRWPPMSAPSFSSFPELPNTTEKKRGESSKARQNGDDRARRGHQHRRSRSPSNERRRKERRREGHSFRDTEESQREDRSRRYDEDGRKRDRHKEERRTARDEETSQEKERRREKERAKALALVRGNEPHRTASDVRPIKKEVDDGVPWYETNKVARRRSPSGSSFNESTVPTWFTDTSGDRDALRYSAASSHNPPKYYRDGRGQILGLNEGLRIVLSRDRTERGVEIAPSGRPYIPRYSHKTIDDHSERRVLLRPPDDTRLFDSNADFVGFPSRPVIANDDTPTYRDISRAPIIEDEDTEVVDQELQGFTTVEQEMREKIIDTERHLKNAPQDVEAWIAYSRLRRTTQEPYAASGIDQAKLPSTRAEAEVTLSILDRALSAHPSNMFSAQLHMAYLQAAEIIWPPDKVTDRWKNVIRELTEGGKALGYAHIEMMPLWLGYLDWREGQGFGQAGTSTGGGVDEVVEVFADCLDKLREASWTSRDPAIEEYEVYLLLRAALFLKQAGYSERATAIFQAIIEITFFKPDRLRPPADANSTWFDSLLDEFEVFWEAEAPRIGEEGAQGWGRTPNSASPPPESSVKEDSDPVAEQPFERWLRSERQAETASALPGRASYLNEDDDPYRVILFEDVRPFMCPIRNPEARLQLVYAFLTFLGLPFAPHDIPSSAPSNTDPRLHWSVAYNDSQRSAFWPPRQARRLAWQTVGGEPMEPEHRPAVQHPFACPVKCWTQDNSSTAARSGEWFRQLESGDLDHIDLEFTKRALSPFRPLIPDPTFTQQALALEAASSPKAALKTAKAILSMDRDNLLLWDAYARLEAQRGNVDAARGVYIASLRSALQAGHGQSEDIVDLWTGWAELELLNGSRARCLRVICLLVVNSDSSIAEMASSSQQGPSPISLLKTRQHLLTLSNLSQSQMVLAALFQYCSEGVDQAIHLVELHRNGLSPGSAEMEQTVQFVCRLLHLHRSQHPTPAATIRDILEEAISVFPNNTQFLSLYLHGEATGRIHGRVQSLVSHIVSSKASTVVGYLWAVWAEAILASRTFWDAGGGGAERVRMVLDKGINSEAGKHCISLWRLYIEFEALHGNTPAAKSLCARAVAANGGCKELYMLPFTPLLRASFSSQELKGWADLMVERGLRVRVAFEDFWQPDEEDPSLVLPDDEELEDDELAFLRERQELKPY